MLQWIKDVYAEFTPRALKVTITLIAVVGFGIFIFASSAKPASQLVRNVTHTDPAITKTKIYVHIAGKVFVVHGGLFSRDDVTLDELRTLDRFREPPDEGPMCEVRRVRTLRCACAMLTPLRFRCSGATRSRGWAAHRASAASGWR